MNLAHYERRITRIEHSLVDLTPDRWTNEELIAALQSCSATPMQMEQIWTIAGDVIRAQIIRLAGYRRIYYQAGGTPEWGVTYSPVIRTIETLSYPADVQIDMAPAWVPPYDPEAWADDEKARQNNRYVPFGFRDWARTYLMDRLLGEDGGLSLRQEIGHWIEGGDPPIDVDRFPDVSVYHLLLPIDGDPGLLFDARMLPLPTVDLWWQIGNYPSFEPPEPDWVPVDISGFERI